MNERRDPPKAARRYPFMHGVTLGASLGTLVAGLAIAYVDVGIENPLLAWLAVVCIAVGGLVFVAEEQGYGWP